LCLFISSYASRKVPILCSIARLADKIISQVLAAVTRVGRDGGTGQVALSHFPLVRKRHLLLPASQHGITASVAVVRAGEHRHGQPLPGVGQRAGPRSLAGCTAGCRRAAAPARRPCIATKSTALRMRSALFLTSSHLRRLQLRRPYSGLLQGRTERGHQLQLKAPRRAAGRAGRRRRCLGQRPQRRVAHVVPRALLRRAPQALGEPAARKHACAALGWTTYTSACP